MIAIHSICAQNNPAIFTRPSVFKNTKPKNIMTKLTKGHHFVSVIMGKNNLNAWWNGLLPQGYTARTQLSECTCLHSLYMYASHPWPSWLEFLLSTLYNEMVYTCFTCALRNSETSNWPELPDLYKDCKEWNNIFCKRNNHGPCLTEVRLGKMSTDLSTSVNWNCQISFL